MDTVSEQFNYTSDNNIENNIENNIIINNQYEKNIDISNVNVNVVCPSQTMSDMLSDSMTSKEIKNLSSNIPLRRIATIDEQVGPILFLCSDLSSYMTGAVIDVNGGQI